MARRSGSGTAISNLANPECLKRNDFQRYGNDSFRFRHRAVAEVICTIAYPAKGGGGYDISFNFRASSKDRVSNGSGASSLRGRIARYELPFGYDDRHARALTLACAEIARMLNAKFTPQQYADV